MPDVGRMPPLRCAASWVQDDENFDFGVSAITKAFGNNVADDNVVVGGVMWLSNTITLDSVTKSAGTATIGAVSIVHNPTTQGTIGRAAMFYVEITGAGSLTMSANFSGSVDAGIIIHEVLGVDLTTPLRGSAMQAQTNPNTGTDALTSGPLSTAASAGDYLFGYFCDPGINGATLTQGTGFTLRVITATAQWSESQVAGGTAATATWNNAFADPISGGLALRAAGAAGGGKPMLYYQTQAQAAGGM